LLLVTSMRTDFHHFRSCWWSRHSKSSTFKFSIDAVIVIHQL